MGLIKKIAWSALKGKIADLNNNNNLTKKEDYRKYIKTVREFYEKDAKGWCEEKGLDFARELIIRRTELKNEFPYWINIGICILTGLITGIGITIIPFEKIRPFHPEKNAGLEGLLWWLLLPSVIFIFTLLVLPGIAKLFNVIINPFFRYAKEQELIVLEKKLKEEME
jgi:hypothetical protein